MYSTILWATDGGVESEHALDEALNLLAPGGKLIAFHADQRFVGASIGGMPVYPDEPDRRERIDEQVHELQERGIDAALFVETTGGDAACAIADAAIECGADLIVCGTRALRGMRGALDSSVAAKILRLASVPVVVVPPGKAALAG